MLQPIQHKLCNADLAKPKDWNEEEHGNCASLPVCRDGDFFYSWYAFGWKDRLKVLIGWPVRLTVVSWAHPPVNLTVAKD